MLEYIKNPETWLTLIAVIISIIALWQTHQQIKLSNKQQLFDRKLSRYLEFNIIYHLYEANKIFLKDDGKFYHTNDLIFSFLTNCCELEEMMLAVLNPLQEKEQKILLTKLEHLKNSAIEISMVFDSEIAIILEEFISVYADLLKALYQQQVYIKKNEEKLEMLPYLEDYKNNCNKMAESLGIFQMRDKLEILSDEIAHKHIIERMKESLRLTKVKK